MIARSLARLSCALLLLIPTAGAGLAAQQPALEIFADPGLETLARSVAADEAVWRPLPGIGAPDAILDDTVRVWIVRDLASLDSIGLSRPETWVAGVADPAGRRIALPIGRSEAELRTTMRHEVAHVALHAATAGNYPLWLTEGYAQLAAGRWGVDDAWRLRFAFARGGGDSLRRIRLRFRRGRLDAELDYMLAYTAVQQLYAMGGDVGLRSLFAELAAGRDFDGALRAVFALTESQFEDAWRRSVTDRYGWLYLISRASVFWILITVLVGWLAVVRFRRDRARLAALREWEVTQEASDIPYDLVFPEWDPDARAEVDPRDPRP